MQPQVKRARVDEEGDREDLEASPDEASSVALLEQLQPVRVLTARSHDKFLALLAKHSSRDEEGIILLEKTPFPAEWPSQLSKWVAAADEVMQNDIYHTLHVTPTEKSGFAQLKVTAIYPATAKHVAKFETQSNHILAESRAVFEAVVRPHNEKTRFNTLWVDNILNGSAEQDRVIHSESGSDLGFVLLPDMKWDGRTLEDLYCLAIVRRPGLTCLRDLHGDDAALLRHVGDVGRRVISERYAIPASQLRVYLHYPPSFYHLHVHFTHADSQVPGQQPERAHLLETVINNLELMADYYQRATLSVRIGENDPLFKLVVAAEKNGSNNCS